jgi:hypothetical protein
VRLILFCLCIAFIHLSHAEEKVITICTVQEEAIVYLEDEHPAWLTLKAEVKSKKKYVLTRDTKHKTDQIVQVYLDWATPDNHNKPMRTRVTDIGNSKCIISYPNVIYPNHVIYINCPTIRGVYYFNLDKNNNGTLVHNLVSWDNIINNGRHKNSSEFLDAGVFVYAKCTGIK